MATRLLAWNPARWPWGKLAAEARLLRKGGVLTGRWGCGNSKVFREAG
jgi:5-methylcytosine-specific restriction protein A